MYTSSAGPRCSTSSEPWATRTASTEAREKTEDRREQKPDPRSDGGADLDVEVTTEGTGIPARKQANTEQGAEERRYRGDRQAHEQGSPATFASSAVVIHPV